MTTVASPIREQVAAARAASRALARCSAGERNAALLRIAALLESEQDAILEANAVDVAAARGKVEPYFIERLTLSKRALDGMAEDTRTVAQLPDPVGEMSDVRTLANGLIVGRRRVPLGVIASIYESRPNVTIDIAALALKSGNACVLRGGKEAQHSNNALGDLIVRALEGTAIPPDAVHVIREPDRAHVDELLQMHDLIDLMVPRGGAGLITHVRDNATMPVVAGGVGVVHVYVDEHADLDMAAEIVDNAKTRRYSICNALDTLIVHARVAEALLGKLVPRWAGTVTLIGDERAMPLLERHRAAGLQVEHATSETWHTEHLALRAGVRLVDSLEEAVAHIAMVNSGHSEAIVTESYENAMRFLDDVDAAAVYVNASTQFTDGAQFGLGAEIGISTQKMHARGPMGLKELTSYKWTILGRGQVRPQ